MPEHGGKRTPGNPAPVSGPGQLSQRTDGGPQQVLDLKILVILAEYLRQQVFGQ